MDNYVSQWVDWLCLQPDKVANAIQHAQKTAEMRLLTQPRTTDPRRFPFNQLDLFLCDLKWLCEFTASLKEGKKNEHNLLFVYVGLIRVYGVLVLFTAVWCCPKIIFLE